VEKKYFGAGLLDFVWLGPLEVEDGYLKIKISKISRD
jgi:hypothetical protein